MDKIYSKHNLSLTLKLKIANALQRHSKEDLCPVCDEIVQILEDYIVYDLEGVYKEIEKLRQDIPNPYDYVTEWEVEEKIERYLKNSTALENAVDDRLGEDIKKEVRLSNDHFIREMRTECANVMQITKELGSTLDKLIRYLETKKKLSLRVDEDPERDKMIVNLRRVKELIPKSDV